MSAKSVIKRGFKHALYILTYYSGLLHLGVRLMKRLKNDSHAVILFYHRFHKETESRGLLPSLSVEDFRKQVRHIKKLYNVMTMDQLADTTRNHRAFQGPSVVLTIDDGYRDNYDLAYPVLRRYGVPATIFLTTGLIGTNRRLWVDEIEYALMTTSKRQLIFRKLLGNTVVDISTTRGKTLAEKMLFQSMLRRDNSERGSLLKELSEILECAVSEKEDRARTMLNWSEVEEMVEGRITFGAHTVTHPFLPVMIREAVETEISESKDKIELHTRKRVRHFAVPNGKREDITQDVLTICREKGFDTVVMTESGIVSSESDCFMLKRVIPPPPTYYFACELARYLLFSQPQHAAKHCGPCTEQCSGDI
jgi:peptidoglycan/xylan/chitin deacetylase (PgdA/CDA1 family)